MSDLNKLAYLTIFLDTSANDDRVLQITKGNVGSVHSRQFVEFLIDKINSTTFLSRFDKVIYGNDELYFPTLNADDNVGKFKMHEKILAVSSLFFHSTFESSKLDN